MTEADTLMPLPATARERADTPSAVARALAHLAEPVRDLAAALTARRSNRLLVAGSGDSLSVGLMATSAFATYTGIPCQAIQAFELARYGHPDLGPRTAVAVVSSSGRPSPAHDALVRAQDSGALVIGICDRKGTPFLAPPVWGLCPGASKNGMPTQSTAATLAILILLALKWGGARQHPVAAGVHGDVAALPTILKGVLRSDTGVHTLGATLAARRHLHIVGAGPNTGTARGIADLLTAAAGLAPLPHAVEEFHHALRLQALTSADLVLVLAPPKARAADRLADTATAARARGAAVAVLGGPDFPIPDLDEPMTPLPLLMQGQALALAAGDVAASAGGFRTIPSTGAVR
ncbi:SIS domain-containing protein [Nitrospirillum iridis]|uniref:Glutamine--fructose-6-phosphate aminotransferase [isomerizing] n=1 Tax=Nitrospirillum iridis TaxID=765888 RepID=A0A7X0EFM3_9PROT|nr:SIS domain-containing protein [Nitrospirillum iridis]MBB6255177.1 fructoselysine-6-P-deglycase FrlB-like protein [Nitrospirillum iridis]